jgi:ribosomal protein L40E
MIDPDTYIDEYYQTNLEALSRAPKNKITNLNFSRLTTEKKVVNLCIQILLQDKLLIKERIDWDLNDEKKSPEKFATKIVEELKDIIDPDLKDYNLRNIKNQILDGLLEQIDMHTFLPKLKLIKKENEVVNNQVCLNCGTVIHNQEFCVNCMFVFEKKLEKKPSEKVDVPVEELRQTERQRILELRQKNVNVEDIAVAYSQENKDKKICKKCGEVNVSTATDCRNCKFKFPHVSFFDVHLNETYAVHFWDKISRNSTIQQLKNFSDFFSGEDFSSLKYLYSKIKYVLYLEFEEILTEEAYSDLTQQVDKIYFSFSNPTVTSEKAFDSAFYNKFTKIRPKNRMLNFNQLIDVKEGWISDTLPDRNFEEKKEEKFKLMDPSLKRKRGRPKKMEIFKTDISKIDENYITLLERDNLMKSDLICEEDLHYDFCGKCDDEGKLICCETCSSAFHFECLGYDKVRFRNMNS